jgi:hypothetical protein
MSASKTQALKKETREVQGNDSREFKTGHPSSLDSKSHLEML